MWLTLGDTERALQLLEEAFARGCPRAMRTHQEPLLDPLRSDPRFQALVEPGG